MLSIILGAITGLAGPIAQATTSITGLMKAKVDAKSNTELAKINSELEQVHDRKAVLLAEAGNRIASLLNAVQRNLMATAVSIIIWKLLVWDKVVGSYYGCTGPAARDLLKCDTFRTDPLDTNQWAIVGAVAGFYFLTSAFGKK